MNHLNAVLLNGIVKNHSDSNRKYLLSLDTERIFANFYIQAGLNSNMHQPPKTYGGWEEPDIQVHGHIAGHYLSACAMYAYYSNDMELYGRVVKAVDILAMCQNENEDGWVGSIPPVYLDRIARKKWVWAPHYTMHKTLMGLVDAYRYCKVEKALKVASSLADWFLKWSEKFSYEEMQDILDWETGGMMEAWADLYGLTGEEKYKILMERYTHYRFFEPMLEGKDILTNTHANTTIPEAHGMARAYQVTGEEKYRTFAQGYLELALNARDSYCTGGQNSGEVWLAHFTHSDLGDQTQEHCTVYNMIRLCEYVMTWDPDVKYADYIEKNVYNGLMAQHRLSDGMNTYYLPLGTGSRKGWTTPHNHMTCCLGTTMQANASYEGRIFYEKDGNLVISQYISSAVSWKKEGKSVKAEMTSSAVGDNIYHPEKLLHKIRISSPEKVAFVLTVRIPAWSAETIVKVNGKEYFTSSAGTCCWLDIPGEWQEDTVEVICKQALTLSRLSETDYYAVLYGPTVLAGLTDNDCCLRGINDDTVCDMIRPRSVHDWNTNTNTWEADNDQRSIVMKALNEIDDEIYTVYFKK